MNCYNKIFTAMIMHLKQLIRSVHVHVHIFGPYRESLPNSTTIAVCTWGQVTGYMVPSCWLSEVTSDRITAALNLKSCGHLDQMHKMPGGIVSDPHKPLRDNGGHYATTL